MPRNLLTISALQAWLLAAFVLAVCCSAPAGAFTTNCKPHRPKPPIILKNLGICSFDPDSMQFAGEPLDQAACLMRAMDKTRNLSPTLKDLPGPLASRIGRQTGLPLRKTLHAFLSQQDLQMEFAAYLWMPLSRAREHNSEAPAARYLVIHDTSGPNYGRRPFPPDIDDSPRRNNLEHFKCGDGWERAHVIINRTGQALLGHDFSIPWRATKFERAVNFDGALKGLFLHVELLQPRRSADGRRRGNDAQPPSPPFTDAQYDRLALMYVIASVRAEAWLVPAFHAAIDFGIPGGHDDPLGFDIEQFARSIDLVIEKLRSAESTVGARSVEESYP
jgi:hypothetical protein